MKVCDLSLEWIYVGDAPTHLMIGDLLRYCFVSAESL